MLNLNSINSRLVSPISHKKLSKICLITPLLFTNNDQLAFCNRSEWNVLISLLLCMICVISSPKSRVPPKTTLCHLLRPHNDAGQSAKWSRFEGLVFWFNGNPKYEGSQTEFDANPFIFLRSWNDSYSIEMIIFTIAVFTLDWGYYPPISVYLSSYPYVLYRSPELGSRFPHCGYLSPSWDHLEHDAFSEFATTTAFFRQSNVRKVRTPTNISFTKEGETIGLRISVCATVLFCANFFCFFNFPKQILTRNVNKHFTQFQTCFW